MPARVTVVGGSALAVAVFLVIGGIGSVIASQGDAIPPALAAMADTERAFSRKATEATPRDAFIEFFADESVNFQPDPGPARERLRKQPPPPAGRPAFSWEPRTGDMAASGDLGYLTGPRPHPPGTSR